MAIEIPITSLYPVDPTHAPANGQDGTTYITYTAWQLLDVAAFGGIVPSGFTSASSLYLRILESTPATALKHKWQAIVILSRPGTHLIDAATVTETFSTEYTSSATGKLQTRRDMAISDGNQIGSTSIQPGDSITVRFSRIAASGSEDSNPIKIIDIGCYAGGAESLSLSSCLGDVGEIITRVKTRSNDADGDLQADVEILGLINECQEDLAESGMWEENAYLDVTSGTYAYALRDVVAFASLVKPLFVMWNGTSGLEEVSECSTQEEFFEYLAYQTTGTVPRKYFWQGHDILLAPTPSATTSNQLVIGFKSLPDDRGCTSNYNLYEQSKAMRKCYVLYALWQRARKDNTNPQAPRQVQEYERAYKEAKGRAMSARRANRFGVRPQNGYL